MVYKRVTEDESHPLAWHYGLCGINFATINIWLNRREILGDSQESRGGSVQNSLDFILFHSDFVYIVD